MAVVGAQYMSVSEAAQMLGVKRQRVYQLLDAGALAGKRTGNTRLVGVASVEARIEKGRESRHPRLEL